MELINFESADGSRVLAGAGWPIGRSTFPTHWGTPPFDLEERTRWIKQNVRAGNEGLDKGERVVGQRARTPKQILAALSRNRESPAFANAARLRLLELLKRGPV